MSDRDKLEEIEEILMEMTDDVESRYDEKNSYWVITGNDILKQIYRMWDIIHPDSDKSNRLELRE